MDSETELYKQEKERCIVKKIVEKAGVNRIVAQDTISIFNCYRLDNATHTMPYIRFLEQMMEKQNLNVDETYNKIISNLYKSGLFRMDFLSDPTTISPSKDLEKELFDLM